MTELTEREKLLVEAARRGLLPAAPAPEPPPDPAGPILGTARAVARGLPIVGGLMDEATAAVSATAAPLFGSGGDKLSWRQRYDAALPVIREADRGFDERHPYLSTGGKLAGGIGGTVTALRSLPGALATPAPTLLGRAGQGAGIGAGIGAGHGFAEGEGGFGNRAIEAAKGGGIGAVVGGVGQPVAEGAVAATRGLYRGLTGTGPSPEATARGALATAIERDKLTPQILNQRIAADRAAGLEPTLADLGGENVHMLARLTGKLPGQGREQMRGFATQRIDDSRNAFWDRVMREFNPENVTDMKAAIAARRAQIGEDMYRPMFAERPTVQTTPELEQFFNTPMGKGYLSIGLRDLQNNTSANVQTLGPAKIGGATGENYYLEALHNIRSNMLGEMRAMKFAGKDHTPEFRNIARGEEQIGKVLKSNKDYAAATKDYADEKAIEGAINRGGKFFTSRPDELRADLAKMKPAEREGYLSGAFDAIEKQARGNGDLAASFLNRPEMQERLRVLFGDKAAKGLIDNLRRISQYKATGEWMNPRQGSQTFPMAAEAGDQASLGSGLTALLSGRREDAIQHLAQSAGSTAGGAALGAGAAGYATDWRPSAMLGGAVAGGALANRSNLSAGMRGLNEPARAELARLLTTTAPNARGLLSAHEAEIRQGLLADIRNQELVRRLNLGLVPSMEPVAR